MFELIVIDDNSEDETRAKAETLKTEFPNLHVLSNEGNAGKKSALQKGITKARFKTIATVDADCRVPSEWLITMTSHWIENQTKMLLGPIVFNGNGTVLQQSQLWKCWP